jgi:hypothetical protein
MPMVITRWIVWLLLLLFIQVAASTVKYQPQFIKKSYLLDAILQVRAVDVNGDHRAELLISGKNYINRELYVYCLEFTAAGKPVVKWRSANLFEENSIIWMAVGNFSGTGRQLMVLTRSRYYCYAFDAAGFRLSAKGISDCEPLGMTAADLDGDALDELILVKVGGIDNNAYNCRIEIRKQIKGKFIPIYQSGLLGNIRAITAGDPDRDGQTELVVETGLRLETGVIRLYHYHNRQLTAFSDFAPPSGGAIYALKVSRFPNGVRLVTGSTRGKINFRKWTKGFMALATSEISLKKSLIDLEVADLNGDRQPELITVSYPAQFAIGTLQ